MHRRDGQLVEIIVLNQILANSSLLTILFMLRLVETNRLAHLKERKCSTTNMVSIGMVERSAFLSTVFDSSLLINEMIRSVILSTVFDSSLLINELIIVCSNNMMLTNDTDSQ